MQIRNLYIKAIKELESTGIKTPELDVRLLLTKALDKESVFLLSHSEKLLSNSEYSKFRRYIRRRKRLEPIAFILGYKEFYGYNFCVNKNVLIPRPETEFLVEKALSIIKSLKSFASPQNKLNIIDIGTGSGCIIISIVKELEKIDKDSCFKFYATDSSKQALKIARKNAGGLGVHKKIRFFHSDLFSNPKLPKSYSIIIANLPYIPVEKETNKLKPTDYEPADAIYASKNGAGLIMQFLDQLKTKRFDCVLLETDSRNNDAIYNKARELFPNFKIEQKKDLAELARYIVIKSYKPSEAL